MQASPIVMIAYKRYDLVDRVLSNIEKCDTVQEHDIFMFIDGFRNESDVEGVKQTELVVRGHQKALPRLNVVVRERNYGCRENIVDAITQIINKFGRVIVVEDDILVSKTFLVAMERALEVYENDSRIWCINGYQDPLLHIPASYKKDVYLNYMHQPWGWATWRNRWQLVDFDMKDWLLQRENVEIKQWIQTASLSLYSLLDRQYQGYLKTWDVQCSLCMAQHRMFAVEPIYSLTKNIGVGVLGEHCTKSNRIYDKQKYFNFTPSYEADVSDCDAISKRLRYGRYNPNVFLRLWRAFESRLLLRMLPDNDNPCNVSGLSRLLGV